MRLLRAMGHGKATRVRGAPVTREERLQWLAELVRASYADARQELRRARVFRTLGHIGDARHACAKARELRKLGQHFRRKRKRLEMGIYGLPSL